ncbi:MAG: hypothetical protein P8Y07_12190 [Gemmatimonadales bacterium]
MRRSGRWLGAVVALSLVGCTDSQTASTQPGVGPALLEALSAAVDTVGVAVVCRIRAEIPSASNVVEVYFVVLTVPSAFVQLARVQGDGQVAEVESQLPLPFVVNASVGESMPVSGIPIAWTVESELGSRLSADTTFTDDNGRAENLLTLGPETGPVTVSAYATRTTASDTIRFTASARAELETGVIVDFVDPLPLLAGQQATMIGAGFSETLG